MNDALFQRWSEQLSQMRLDRETRVQKETQEKGVSYTTEELFTLCGESLEAILEQWFAFEQQSLEGADLAAALPALRRELDSVIDFETEAIGKDAVYARGQAHWDERIYVEAEAAFQAGVSELRKKYQLKIDGLAGSGGSARRRLADVIASQTPAASPSSLQMSYSNGGSSGMGMIVMFVVGLLLGGGPSFYFWNNAKEADQARQDDAAKWQAEKRALQDSMTVLNESFVELATGRMKSLADIDREISRIKADSEVKKADVMREYNRVRSLTMRHTRAGERLDRAIHDLDQERDSRLQSISSKEAAAVEPLAKQRALLSELLPK